MHWTNTLLNVVLTTLSSNPGDMSHIHIVTGWNDTVTPEFIHASVICRNDDRC